MLRTGVASLGPTAARRADAGERARARRAHARAPRAHLRHAGRARGRGLRAARGRGRRERAAVPRGVGDRAGAADVPAPAASSRTSRARSWPPPTTRRAQGLEVGGDFYDVFSTGEGQWYLVIGDVCGKGAEAAAVTALTRYTIRSAAARERSPAAILRWVDEAMLTQDGAGGRFCTVACVHVDVSGPVAQATVACGGHPLAVVRRADGQVELFGSARDAARAAGRRGAAGGLDGAAPRRLARALHGRAHRGARAAAHVGRGRADGRGPQRPDERADRAGRQPRGRRAGRPRPHRATTWPCSSRQAPREVGRR